MLANAALVITSTHNEIEEQYGLYNYYDPARMAVIPPGTDLEQFHPPQKRRQHRVSPATWIAFSAIRTSR